MYFLIHQTVIFIQALVDQAMSFQQWHFVKSVTDDRYFQFSTALAKTVRIVHDVNEDRSGFDLGDDLQCIVPVIEWSIM